MKTRKSTKIFLFALMMICFSAVNMKAQVSSCDQCVENNANCDIQIIVTFYCNGSPCTNTGAVNIPSKTTKCFQSPCVGCVTCDMEIELVGVNSPPNSPPPCTISAPNKVSMSNPGPVYPTIPAPCDQCFDGGSQTPEMKYTSGLFMVGF